MRDHGWLRTVLLAGAASLALVAPALAEPRDFRVPPGDLAQALDAYARQSSDQILYSSDLVRGASTAGVSGRMEPEAALARILDGTNLSVRRGPSGAVIVAARAETSQLEEIVVTAQRREESLQDVSIAVTALSTANLEAKQILDVMSLNKAVPGFASRPLLSPLEITTAIRGVYQVSPSIVSDPAIGLYADGVYNGVTTGSNLGMIDMERVEVLKGPQGTLFGRNTIGGAISITTAKPTGDFGGYVQAKLGNHDSQTYTGVVNGPLIPGVLDARLVYQHAETDGYGRNFTTGGRTNSLNQEYVRGTIRVTPADGWEVIAQAFYTDTNGTTAGSRLGYIDPDASLAPGVLPPTSILLPLLSGAPNDTLASYVGRGGYWDTFSNVSGYWMKQYGGMGTITGQLNDAVTVKSITAYSKTRFNTASDLDATPYEVLDLITFPVDAKQFSQEFQIYGDALDDRLSWIAGLYYFGINGSELNNFVVLGPFSEVPTHSNSGPYAKTKSYSAFAQLTYEIAPKIRLTGGVRYVVDKRDVTYRDHTALGATAARDVNGGVSPGTFLFCDLANAPGSTDPAACVFRDSVEYDFTPWTVGVDYRPNDDTLLYAKISKGYRSGAYPQGGPPANPDNPEANPGTLALFGPVAPERLVSYEAGAKLDLLDRRLRVNAAGYWSKYDNLQASVNREVPGCPTCGPVASLETSGSAEIWGGELEVTALIGNLTLDGLLGYTHPKYVSGVNLGAPIVGVPKLNYAIGASYPIETSAGTLTLSGSYAYQSKVRLWSLDPDAPPPIIAAATQKSYALLDARASFELESAPVTISVYGQNLANKKYYNAATSIPLGYVVQFPGAPRTYGVELRYRF